MAAKTSKITGATRVLMVFGVAVVAETASGATFTCIEEQRHSFVVESSMTPAYPGRKINFTIKGNEITADGVFFHSYYDVRYLSDQAEDLSFRAHASDADREDIFLFLEKTLYHTAIVKYGREPSIQLNILTCEPKIG